MHVAGSLTRRQQSVHTLQRNQASVNSPIFDCPIFDFLHAEPRYQAIMNKMRLASAFIAMETHVFATSYTRCARVFVWTGDVSLSRYSTSFVHPLHLFGD
jgi:hypothetical protein